MVILLLSLQGHQPTKRDYTILHLRFLPASVLPDSPAQPRFSSVLAALKGLYDQRASS